MNFLERNQIDVVLGAQADGTGTQTSSIVDMSGFESATFVALFDDVDNGAVLTLSVEQNTANSASGMAAVSGSATITAGATNADDKALALEVYKPRERYLRASLVIGSANATTCKIICIRSRAAVCPVTQGLLDTSSITLVSPAEA